MKQGKATTYGNDSKTEPRSMAINPGYAGGLGSQFGNHADGKDFAAKITPMDAGRGYSAPGIGVTSHPCGSQGKHK